MALSPQIVSPKHSQFGDRTIRTLSGASRIDSLVLADVLLAVLAKHGLIVEGDPGTEELAIDLRLTYH